MLTRKLKNFSLVLLLLIPILGVSLSPNQVEARSGTFEYIERIFFYDLFIEGRGDLYDRAMNSLPSGSNVGVTETLGIGKNCSGSDDYGPTCEEYFFTHDPMEPAEEIFFYNIDILLQDAPMLDNRVIVVSGDPLTGIVRADDPTTGLENSQINIRDPNNLSGQMEENLQSTTDGQDGESEEGDCEDAGVMAWIFCAVLGVVSSGLAIIDSQMINLLSMDPEFFQNDQLREGWAVLRNIAYLLLVPTMLVMIISTALGFEFVSAYTIKSALPRMVAATIFIALSYEITTFLVNFVQVLGFGIHNLLLFPFEGLDHNSTLIDVLPLPESGAERTVLSGLLAWGAVAAGAATLGGGLVATLAGFVGVALLALLLVLILLLFRQTLILLLILISPLAILAWIFPGRTRVWSLWNKTFWLMMWFFPIIMATTAVGKIMAHLVSTGNVF